MCNKGIVAMFQSLSSFSRVQLLQPPGLWPARLFCPWNSPGKNIGVGCHFLLQVWRMRGSETHSGLGQGGKQGLYLIGT